MPRDFLSDEMGSPVNEKLPGRDFLEEAKIQEQPQENIGTSIAKVPFRIGEDIYKGGVNLIKNIPQYYESAKSEVPGIFSAFRNDPFHALSQVSAGIAELGQNTFNMPHDVINYLSKRLNIVPQDLNKMVQMGRMPEDTQQAINQVFGMPNQPGEELIRGIPRNALNIAAGSKALSVLNPINLRYSNIAKNVVKEEGKQIKSHTKQYNQIWNEADKYGYNQVPIDKYNLSKNLDVIEKYKTPKEYQALKDFIKNPTLEKAQRAQSDMGVISRALEEKSKKGSLLSEEKLLFNAAKEAEKHIEENMFKNNQGEINNSLQKKYKKLSRSYRENVVPYKYNKDIQDFKNRKIKAKELVNSLSHGEFAVKKGSSHPAIGIRNFINPTWNKAGTMGVMGLLYNNIMGNKTSENP